MVLVQLNDIVTSLLDIDNYLSGLVEDNKDKRNKLSPKFFLTCIQFKKNRPKKLIYILLFLPEVKDQIVKNIRKNYSQKAKIIYI